LACLARWRVRLDQPHQLRPRNHQVHFVKKLTLAPALGGQFETSSGKALLLHHLVTSEGGFG
jgi:hypothetical protein